MGTKMSEQEKELSHLQRPLQGPLLIYCTTFPWMKKLEFQDLSIFWEFIYEAPQLAD